MISVTLVFKHLKSYNPFLLYVCKTNYIMQYIQNKEEEEAMTNGDWGDDIYDHSEERERDRLLGEQEELDRRYE